MKRATLKEVQTFFGMTAQELMAEWKELDDHEKDWFKTAVYEEIHND